jgi:hypothetical protein
MAAGLAAELEKNLEDAVVETERGPKQSELAVLVDGELIFSRLEQMRYPEARELIAICRSRAGS